MVGESMVDSEVLDRIVERTVILASADAGLRQRLRTSLTGLRWQVREAGGGAEAIAQMEALRPEAILVDSWLPDLEVSEFTGQIRLMYPETELLRIDGVIDGASRSPRRNELLHALREADHQAMTDTSAWANAPVGISKGTVRTFAERSGLRQEALRDLTQQVVPVLREREESIRMTNQVLALPEMVGASEPVRELARLIRLVAPRSTTVLIEGETGTGKEVVARAVHRLSERAGKPFVVLNCAAIPETLLEAELFGHTRGAFTGAVQSRTGRIEAAHGGTLFLDEIGEMPLALQAKMLRFLECGELQRVGDNETMRVDVRVVAATHQPLEQRAEEGTFRLDLYYWLRLWLENGVTSSNGTLPGTDEDMSDHIFTIGARA